MKGFPRSLLMQNIQRSFMQLGSRSCQYGGRRFINRMPPQISNDPARLAYTDG